MSKEAVVALLKKAAAAPTSEDAMRFSQAANNAANAMGSLGAVLAQKMEIRQDDYEEMTEDQIKHMVNRFLGWRLPEDFNPDGGINFTSTYNDHMPAGPQKCEPIGTNLFSATQADAMVRYMIDGMPK